MNIKYLTLLRDNPIGNPGGIDFKDEIKGISLAEIQQLEQTWNGGKEFPAALRELLFLAGDDCYVLDTGLMESQQEMQEEARQWLVDFNRTISRPFYVIDVYNAGEQFLMVYLDEGDDPNVYEAYLPNWRDDQMLWLDKVGRTLKDFINIRIDMVKQGYNPF
jgi:hypothetical protein